MQLLVSNPSILVALEHVDLLELLFALPLEISVTDFLYERELKDYDGQKLLGLGLQIQKLEAQMTSLTAKRCQDVPSLCRDEMYAFVIAQARDCRLLTINPDLVELARAESINYYPLSSLFNLMLDRGSIARSVFLQKVAGIAAISRCPLVRKEVEVCLFNLSRCSNSKYLQSEMHQL